MTTYNQFMKICIEERGLTEEEVHRALNFLGFNMPPDDPEILDMGKRLISRRDREYIAEEVFMHTEYFAPHMAQFIRQWVGHPPDLDLSGDPDKGANNETR
jgi:hypothetical protein